VPDAFSIARRFRGFLPVIVDVETGGFNCKTDALLDIAAVFVDPQEDGTFLRGNDRYHVKPFEGANMDPASLAVNGIDPHHRCDRQSTSAMRFAHLQKVRRVVRESGCTRAILVGHNASFDLGFLNEAVLRSDIKRNPFHPFSSFDTATLCGIAYGQTVLARAVSAAGLTWDESSAHSAAYDAEITADIFCDIVNRFQPIFDSIRVPDIQDTEGEQEEGLEEEV
jgi:ribonuclease T